MLIDLSWGRLELPKSPPNSAANLCGLTLNPKSSKRSSPTDVGKTFPNKWSLILEIMSTPRDSPRSVPLAEIVWPYRPDLLIRVDFLEWLRDARAMWPGIATKFDAEAVRGNSAFFAEACRHPYFLQFSRKKQFRNAPPSLREATGLYASGIAAFLALASSIEGNGYDPFIPIHLRISLIQRHSGFAGQQRRRWFIGDGCHRYACLAWRERGADLPFGYFALEHRLVHTPLDWRALLARAGLLGSAELSSFDAMFAEAVGPNWEEVLDWGRRVRERYRGLDFEKVFSIRL